MPHPNEIEIEPPLWRKLYSEFKRENDPAKFQALLEEIHRALTAYEKSNSQADKLV
jgi:hypothetical protein